MIEEYQAIKLLREGKVVAIPTETVYGLAADATNPAAIARVFEIKNRPADNPLICHFHSINLIKDYVNPMPEQTELLMRHFLPGPISFMLDLPSDSPLKFATCGSNQVIVRIPDHSIALSIIEGLNAPVAAPSANTSGRVSPTSAIMVTADLGNKPDGIVDGGPCKIGLESSIVDARSENEIIILRPGAIGMEEISKVIPSSKIVYHESTVKDTIPGAKYAHYAPATAVSGISEIESLRDLNNTALLLTAEQASLIPEEIKMLFNKKNIQLIILGSTANLNDLAKNFYLHLNAIDKLGISKAYYLKNNWDNSSLGLALKNRISKVLTE